MALPDVRIVIVSWNVEHHLQRCLASLPAACTGLTYDVVVVDNASTDASVAAATSAGVTVITNTENRGFAAACNQGMAGSRARYVLLLNPDTECPPGSLTTFLREADSHAKVGIFGPRLVHADGAPQASIRRFPTVWNQVGVMLKLHHVFPWLFRHYFATDRAVDLVQDADQVMGACFLIRRALIDEIGGLDERYFIWFEEVDYCRQAKQHGWAVRYLPSVVVTHWGGQSFDQVLSTTKQRYFNASLVAYFQKWHPGIQALLIRAVRPVSFLLAWLVAHMPYTAWVAVILGIELVSRLTIFQDTANAIATIVVGIVVAIIAWKRPTLGLAILALELLIGSHGRLLQVWGWPGVVSLRMMLFAAFFVGWGAKAFWRVSVLRLLKERWEWVLVGLAIVYGTFMGVLHNPMVGADANAWVYALLLIPVVHLARTQHALLLRHVLPVLLVGMGWLVAKAIGIEYVFAHGLAVVNPPTDFYLWIRRTGVGEITPLTPVFHRVFMQSQVFALPALLFGTSYYFATHEKGFFVMPRRAVEWMLGAAVVLLLIGYSRSLWIGAMAGMLVLIGLHLRTVAHAIRVAWTAVRGVCYLLISVAILALAALVPIPSTPYVDEAGGLTQRFSASDAAAASRWDLLRAMQGAIAERPVFGYGLGATLTYQSSDPRVLAANSTGSYTTYAFEWGWLDHWFKLGLFGLLAMVVLLVRIAMRILRTHATPWIKYGAFASLVALAVTHFFTPYLNHPLGLGYLILLEGWVVLHTT